MAAGAPAFRLVGEGGRVWAGQARQFCCSMYWRMTEAEAPPTDPAKQEPDHSGLSPGSGGTYRGIGTAVSGGHAVAAVDQAGDRRGGREFQQQVEVPGFAGELGQFGAEACMHIPHDLPSAPDAPP